MIRGGPHARPLALSPIAPHRPGEGEPAAAADDGKILAARNVHPGARYPFMQRNVAVKLRLKPLPLRSWRSGKDRWRRASATVFGAKTRGIEAVTKASGSPPWSLAQRSMAVKLRLKPLALRSWQSGKDRWRRASATVFGAKTRGSEAVTKTSGSPPWSLAQRSMAVKLRLKPLALRSWQSGKDRWRRASATAFGIKTQFRPFRCLSSRCLMRWRTSTRLYDRKHGIELDHPRPRSARRTRRRASSASAASAR